MKYILRLFLTLLIVSIHLYGEATPHLILNFDINKTLIASDKAGKKSVEDVLNELLAEKYSARWDESLQEEMTFDVYIKHILIPGPEDNSELNKQRKLYLQHFIDYLLTHDHPLCESALADYGSALRSLQISKGTIFASFYHLIRDLDAKEISYSIILRSFGDEVLEVKNEINAHYKTIFNRLENFRLASYFWIAVR